MPFVTIRLFPGRTKEQKAELVKAITEDFQKILGVKPEVLHIVFEEIPKEHWATAGALHA